jgi:hypothetical protein
MGKTTKSGILQSGDAKSEATEYACTAFMMATAPARTPMLMARATPIFSRLTICKPSMILIGSSARTKSESAEKAALHRWCQWTFFHTMSITRSGGRKDRPAPTTFI